MDKLLLIIRLLLLAFIVGYFYKFWADQKKKKISKLQGHVITHSNEGFDVKACEERLRNTPKLSLSLKDTLEILKELEQFALGRFLLRNKGLNGYWTSYVVLHNRSVPITSPLEEFMIYKSPVCVATRERFQIFQKMLQQYIQPKTTIASIPCGVCDDFMELPPNPTLRFVGIDLDDMSLKLAKAKAAQGDKSEYFTFAKKDAWNLEIKDAYDIVVSNGLNIYEPDDRKVIKLYQNFAATLKKGGKLITSFLTPPPTLSKESPWINLDTNALLKEKAIFKDIIQVNWRSYRTERLSRRLLEEAGFKVIDVVYDKHKLFPTIVAEKKS